MLGYKLRDFVLFKEKFSEAQGIIYHEARVC